MNNRSIVSLFDGASCGQAALNRANIAYDSYHAFEIDKYAIKVAHCNHPKTMHHGSVVGADFTQFKNAFLLMGGSPCQGFSFAGKQLAFDDPRSALFFEFVRAKREINPKYFFLENVKMKKDSQDVITNLLEVEPIEFNAALVGAQNRKRLYWTNIPFEMPKDRGIFLKDILENSSDISFNYSSSGRGNGIIEDRSYIHPEKAHTLTASGYSSKSMTGIIQVNSDKSCGGKQPSIQDRIYDSIGKSPALKASFASRLNIIDDKYYLSEKMLSGIENSKSEFKDKFKPHDMDTKKSYCLTARYFKMGKTDPYIKDNFGIRKLTPIECERLQGLPDNYTSLVSNTQRYKMIGNGWQVDAIVEFFKNLK